MAKKKTGRRPSKTNPQNSPIKGDRIRLMLAELGWTQEQLARKAELPLGVVNRIIRGVVDPGCATLIKLIDAFDCPADKVLRRKSSRD
jgi:transcriptional regulator with XRE-family HTH domain